MNDLPQSGLPSALHLDADQLSAFAEHALWPPEREQALAHLAICPDCRAVLALSLPPLEQATVLQPASPNTPRPARRWTAWFTGHPLAWNIAWPAAAAFAAFAVITLHLRQAVPVAQRSTAAVQVAAAPPPEPLAPPAPAARARAFAPPPPAAPAPSPQTPLPTPTAPHPAAASVPAGVESDSAVVRALPPAPNVTLSLGKASGAPAPVTNANRPEAVSLGSTATPPGAASGAGSAQMAVRSVHLPAPPAPVAAAPPPAMPADVIAGDVAAAASAGQANNSIALKSNARFARAPLPGGLPPLSTAVSGPRILSLDTRGALFLSLDGGQHWAPVASPWTGRAVRVDLAGPIAANFAAGPASGNGAFGRMVAAAPQSAPAGTAAAGPALTGTVTDTTGAVIPNASIIFTGAASSTVRTARTDPAGRYTLPALPPGPYTLDIAAIGFATLHTSSTLTQTPLTRSDLKLSTGSASQSVTVQTAASDIGSESLSQPAALAKKAAPPKPTAPPPPPPPPAIFEITTDIGTHWSSPDGQTWTPQ